MIPYKAVIYFTDIFMSKPIKNLGNLLVDFPIISYMSRIDSKNFTLEIKTSNAGKCQVCVFKFQYLGCVSNLIYIFSQSTNSNHLKYPTILIIALNAEPGEIWNK